MRSVYVSRTSQNRSPPASGLLVYCAGSFDRHGWWPVIFAMVSGLCGLCGRKFMHKENKKWR